MVGVFLTHLVKPADYAIAFLHLLPFARSVGKTVNPKPVRPTYLDRHAVQCYYTCTHIAHKLRDVQQIDSRTDRLSFNHTQISEADEQILT